MTNIQFTILVPIFNEEECLPIFFEKMDAFLTTAEMQSCVLLINDGSSDQSLPIIQKKCREHDRYHYISLDKNRGLSTAIKAGFDTCTTEFVGYIDVDLQTDPEDFNLLFSYMSDVSLATGIRQKRKDTLVKKMSSKIANFIRRNLVKDNITDSCCPLKVLRTDMAKKLPFFNGMHRFIPALVQLKKGTVKEVPVRHYPRVAGTAKYHLFNRLIGPFFDMLAFCWMRKRNIEYVISSSSL